MIFYWEDHERTAFVINCFLLSGSDSGTLACEQALQSTLVAGWEKEGELATTSLEFEYLHQKVDENC